MSLRICFVLSALSVFTACGSDDGGGGAANGGSGGTSNGGSGGSDGGSGGSTGGTGGTGASATGGTGGTPGEPGIRYIGRYEQTPEGTKMAWSGSGMAFRFSGTEASVSMDDGSLFFTVVVDGQVQAPLETQPGEQLYPIASGLPAGEHEVFLYRRTEASFGDTNFIDVELGLGTLLAPPPAPARRIEVIGDSITCGYGNEGPNESCGFTADTENHYLTYGAIAARNLDAELTTIAWSGKGIIFNYGDDKNEPLPEIYDRVLPYDTSLSWNFSWQPDVVVINLGTNDFSTDGDPTENEFGGAYSAFLDHLREKYPNANILCLVPTLLGGSDLSTAESYIQNVVTQKNDAKIEAFSMNFTQTGWGCDYHPSLATHESMGEALTQKLKTLMGW
jgi:lysophospholipase L1-like esterase